MDDAERGANATITIDLETQEIRGPDGGMVKFDIDPFRKQCLLNGLDDIGLTLVKARPSTPSRQGRREPPLAVRGGGPGPAGSPVGTPEWRRPVPSGNASNRNPCCAFAAARAALRRRCTSTHRACLSGPARPATSAKGVSATTFDAATSGLQPDMKVVEFLNDQPEFKTPIWDYLAALVDRSAWLMAGHAAAMAPALAVAEARYGVDRIPSWRSGASNPISASRSASGPCAIAGDALLLRTRGRPISHGVHVHAEDPGSRRRRCRPSHGIVGRGVRPHPVHALHLPAPRGRPRRRRAAGRGRFHPRRAGSTANYLDKSGSGVWWNMGLRGEAAVGLQPAQAGPRKRRASTSGRARASATPTGRHAFWKARPG